MKKPFIDLTPSRNTENQDIGMRPTYLKALKAAGAILVVLPLEIPREDLAQLVDVLDGFLFVGGPDVHPFLFGEEAIDGRGSVSLQRDTMELNLFSLAINVRKPVPGICRGIQLTSIGLGGIIYQDVKSQYQIAAPIARNWPFYYDIPRHTVNVTVGTMFSRITGSLEDGSIQANSAHHQSAKNLAPGLIVCGHSLDGLIEAVEKPDYFSLMAVQQYPEYLREKDSATVQIFRVLVDACKTI